MPPADFPVRRAPARFRGWAGLLALYLAVAVVAAGAILVLTTPGPRLRAAGRRLGALAWKAAGQAVPTARFLFAADQNLAREIVRSGLPVKRGGTAPDPRGWLDRLVQGVTGLNPSEPESFLRQTLIARGGLRPRDYPEEAGDSEPAVVPETSPAAPAVPTGEAHEPVPTEPQGTLKNPGKPAQALSRRTEPELRRYPWGTAPLIGVYHTHSSETYHGPNKHPKGGSYDPSDFAWGKTGGMIAIGDELARVLTEDYRIPVVHSRNIHDYPVYRDAYANSAATVKEMLRKYPSLRIILDLHRDGLADLDRDYVTTVMGGERLARVSLIVGRGQPGLPNAHWERNLALAEQLNGKLEEMYLGLSRGVTVRNWPYNQELSDRLLLVEVGDHYNTREEALKSAALLADSLAAVLADLSPGVNQSSSHGGL